MEHALPIGAESEPSSLVTRLSDLEPLSGRTVLDAGCGEGKNSSFLASRGALVTAIDISATALAHAERGSSAGDITWRRADISNIDLGVHVYDVVIAYGLYHCLASAEEITDLYSRLEVATKPSGVHVICCFNARRQELDAAHPGFRPCLLDHVFYRDLYAKWQVIVESDSDLTETHPDMNIQHTHSMTRILARKGGLR